MTNRTAQLQPRIPHSRRATTPREREHALEKSRQHLDNLLTRLKRLTTSIRFTQRRVRYYEREALKSDAQRATEREAAASARRRRASRTRRIRVGVGQGG